MQSTKVRKILAAGGALLVLGGAAIGVTAVQAQGAAPNGQQQQQNLRSRYEQALASHLNVTVDQLRQAMTDARKDVGLPNAPARPGAGAAPGFRGFPGRGQLGGFFGQEADAVAALFKEDRAALLNEVPGKTLAEVASAHSVSTTDLVNAITSPIDQRIDQAAQNRNIPADRVSQMKQRISERGQEFVTTHRFPARGSGTRS